MLTAATSQYQHLVMLKSVFYNILSQASANLQNDRVFIKTMKFV
jgi:hypothetical protein